MPITLKDMLKKAENKGYCPSQSSRATKPWHQNIQKKQIKNKEIKEKTKKIKISPPAPAQTNKDVSNAKTEPNLSQTEAKLEPQSKRSHIGAKTEPYRSHIGAKTEPKRSHIGAISEPQTEPVSEPYQSQNGAISEPYRSQNGAISEPYQSQNGASTRYLEEEDCFTKLSGLHRTIVLYMRKLSILSRNKCTSPISSENIASHCNTTISSIKKALQRLEKRNFISRKGFKRGRGGWTQYMLSDALYQEILHVENQYKTESYRSHIGAISEPKRSHIGAKTESYRSQNEAISESQTEPQTEPNPLSSSSINNLKTTTTELPMEWETLYFEDLAPHGFTKNHLVQLHRAGSIEPEMLQSSIEHFEFDLKHNAKAKKITRTPVEFFMGIIRRHGYYNAPENYESPRDKAMRLRIEQIEKEKSERARLKQRVIEAERRAWADDLSEEDLDSILPKKTRSDGLKGLNRGYIQEYFVKNVLPGIKKKHSDIFEQED